MVKTTMFNGMTHPAIAHEDGRIEVVRRFGYETSKPCSPDESRPIGETINVLV
jgi:hypothetical protein